MGAMKSRTTWLITAMVVAGLGAGGACVRRPTPPRPRRRATHPPVVIRRPAILPDPLARPAEIFADGVALPELIGLLEARHGIRVSISPTIPVDEWQRVRVCVAMPRGTWRAFFDWLVRPLRAHYSLEADGGVWVSRSEDLLEDEPLVLRTYRVPTHLVSSVPLPGALAFEREQDAIIETLETCLGYLLARRPECTLAFHGHQDVLVARLPARGHSRLARLLAAIRFGTPPVGVASPTREDIKARLGARIEWSDRALPARKFVAALARKAKVNIGCDLAALGAKPVVVNPGRHAARELLDALVRQTPIGRYELEGGHGIWLYPEGEDQNFPLCGASRWDAAEVRAYDVRPLLRHLSAKALLVRVKRQVDPGEWERGLPAASVFLPTARLVVVHDPAGQRRVAAVLAEMARQFARMSPMPSQ